jgi:hypothetical protein
MRKRLQDFRKDLSLLFPVLVMTILITTGSYYFMSSRAASPVVSLESESGTISAPASVISDTTAASGKAVKFAAPTPTSTQRFPGDPNPRVTGKAYWGSAYSGNGDVRARYETTAGKSLSIHRTFWQWDQHDNPASDGLYNMVKADHAANRLPLISTKTPSWAEVAAGRHDARIDQLLRTLDSYGKPVWLTFHHEPEGGGGINSPDDPGGAAAWRGMQQRVRMRMTALKTKNIAFMPILMAWTANPSSGRNINDWWVPGIWDAYIVDHYNDREDRTMFDGTWSYFTKWVEEKNMPYGYGEWGNRGVDAKAATEMREHWEYGFKNKKDIIAYCYFDSGLNSPTGAWTLTGEPLKTFIDILKSDTRVMRINELR